MFTLYWLYTGYFQASSKRFAHVGAERQTNIHTCIHTYIHTYIRTHFRKTISGQAPGLKTLCVGMSNSFYRLQVSVIVGVRRPLKQSQQTIIIIIWLWDPTYYDPESCYFTCTQTPLWGLFSLMYRLNNYMIKYKQYM